MNGTASRRLEEAIRSYSVQHGDTLAQNIDKLQEFQQIWPYLDNQMTLDQWKQMEVDILEDGCIRLRFLTHTFSLDIDYNPDYLEILRQADFFSIEGLPETEDRPISLMRMDLVYPSLWTRKVR